MQNVLSRIVFEAGKLLEVEERRFEGSGNFVTSLSLTFDRFTAHFSAHPDDDTLLVSDGIRPRDEDCVEVSISSQLPWAPSIGRKCHWAWLLTNQQGYTDGIRFEFGADSECTIIEMIVVASAIQCFESVRCR